MFLVTTLSHIHVKPLITEPTVTELKSIQIKKKLKNSNEYEAIQNHKW